jgi:hypothetical protein
MYMIHSENWTPLGAVYLMMEVPAPRAVAKPAWMELEHRAFFIQAQPARSAKESTGFQTKASSRIFPDNAVCQGSKGSPAKWPQVK